MVFLSSGRGREGTPDTRQAAEKADFVQENATERPQLKAKLFADLDDAAPRCP